jgi:hypothetical protein
MIECKSNLNLFIRNSHYVVINDCRAYERKENQSVSVLIVGTRFPEVFLIIDAVYRA